MLRPRQLLRRRLRLHRRRKLHRRPRLHPRQKPHRLPKPHRRLTLRRRQRAQASKPYSPDVAATHVDREKPGGQSNDSLRLRTQKSHECEFVAFLFRIICG